MSEATHFCGSFIPNLYIVVGSFLNLDRKEKILGGTETYTDALIRLAKRHGGSAVVFQWSKTPFHVKLVDDCQVVSWANVAELRMQLRRFRQNDRGVVVQYEDTFVPETDELPCVVVQHGIGGDGTADAPGRPHWLTRLADLRRRWRYATGLWGMQELCRSVNHVLCVDTNFINHMRSAVPMYDWGDRLLYIPNFADIPPEDVVRDKWASAQAGALTVLFARRFEFHRGISLWVECVYELAKRFPGARFRFIGYGVGEKMVRELRATAENVEVYARPYEAMREEFRQAHISVVPSLWSEGTSLSCIESMAAGCVPVVSTVGGLGNLVIPNYNGFILPPTVDAFKSEVGRLIENPALAKTLGLRSYDMAREAFSREIWEKRVLDILRKVPLATAPLPSPSRRFKPDW